MTARTGQLIQDNEDRKTSNKGGRTARIGKLGHMSLDRVA
jgi:hypothetical protein